MLVRSRGVSEALVEPLALMTGSQTEGFAELYERTFPRVYAYVASLVRDRAAAEDVTAQAFERAYRKRRSYRAGRGTMEAWLFGIARNAALDELRRRKRRAGLERRPRGQRRAEPARSRRAGAAPRNRARRARFPRRSRTRPDCPEVRRRSLERGDRPGPRHVRVRRRHPSAPNHYEVARGMP